MELGLVHQLFRQARSETGASLYDVMTCAVLPGEIRTDADFTITVEHGPEVLAVADTVIVPASHETDVTESQGRLGGTLEGALSFIRPGTRVASICTGAFLLAAAGWLDGRRATTHWKSAEQFRALFPAVELDPDVLYIDEGNILTSAGEAAGIDLCLHLIRQDHGAAIANDVARATVVPPHRDGGQAQFIKTPVTEPGNSFTGRARTWALRNLHRRIRLTDLAAQEATSARTFTRRFREEVGISPGHWLTQRRIDHARQLLEDTELPIDAVARQSGFGTAVSLRQQFHAVLGVAPSSYRRTFRGPGTPEVSGGKRR